MSEREEQDFLKDYLTWMKGPGLDQESLHIYNFGYERTLPFPSISLTPDSTLRLKLQTSGMQTQSRWSTVVIGKKYLDRFEEIMTVIDRIHEDTQALPFAIFVETEDDMKITNISSHVTPTLVTHFISLCPPLSIIDNTQVHIPQRRSKKSFISRMKCEASSNTTHDVLISKEISYKTYKEICSGEPKKVNLGFYDMWNVWSNTLWPYPPAYSDLYGEYSAMSEEWEIFYKFFSIHNIEPNWLHCNTSGHYDEDLGGWTGCMGKV